MTRRRMGLGLVLAAFHFLIGFPEGSYIAVSIEARKEVGESYGFSRAIRDSSGVD